MKVVWMVILMATGAMFLIAATLLVRPFDSDGSFLRPGKLFSEPALCLFCDKAKTGL